MYGNKREINPYMSKISKQRSTFNNSMMWMTYLFEQFVKYVIRIKSLYHPYKISSDLFYNTYTIAMYSFTKLGK